MGDTTVTKVSSAHSPKGSSGQKYLASGKNVAMRLWEDEPPTDHKPPTRRDYETVGYVIRGRAELTLEGQTVRLEPGDSWVVPKGSDHSYRILEPFATARLSLTKIESRPTRRKPWEYVFFVDFEGHRDDPVTQGVLAAVRERCLFLKVLGSYPVLG